MRRLSPDEAIKTFDEVLQGYNREEAMAEAKRALGFDLAVSAARCPFDVDIPRFVSQVAQGDFDSALATIRDAHLWPEVFGRVCHKFCEIPHSKGRRILEDGGSSAGAEAPFLSALEWAAGTWGDRSRSPFKPGPATGHRVAVVGAGSAGLGAAWHLRRCGHAVDIFEKDPFTGGLLISGYPTFRMDKGAVRRENDPTEWGVNLHLNHPVDADEMRRLVAEFDAVFVSAGRAAMRSLDIPGDELPQVMTALDVLRTIWLEEPPKIGSRVMVVGAGFTALDIARAALRLGCAPVEIVYRRGVNDMLRPGLGQMFVRALEEEGVRFRFMADPVRILGEDGRVVGVELAAMEYTGEPDETGRPGTRPIPGSEEVVPVDTVFRAVGETIEVEPIVGAVGVQLTDKGFIKVDAATKQTTNPKVFAGGDVIGTNGNEGAAYDALVAARAMDALLRGELDAWRPVAATHLKDMRW